MLPLRKMQSRLSSTTSVPPSRLKLRGWGEEEGAQ